MLKGISLGIGLTLGILIAIICTALIVLIIVVLYRRSLRRKFSLDLFLKYQKELIRNERFEELHEVNRIIEQLKKKEKPKEMYEKYKVDVDSYLYWTPTYDGGERYMLRHDKKIIRKKPL
jgi:predicted tellurium resistance membrane protein TerC